MKRNPKYEYDSLYKQLLENDHTPYEHFNINVSKHSLQLPKRTSNVACRAELGRLPLRHFILVSVLKFQVRMILLDNLVLIKAGYQSQLIRSGAVFRSEGSPLNPKDLLQIYVILAVGACVLCQFKVCCDVC